MPSITKQLDDARKGELLDLTLRNPLIHYRTLKTRGVEVIDERPSEVFQILVRENRRMSFLPVTDEEKEKLSDPDAEEGFGDLFGQPDESEAVEQEQEQGPADTAPANTTSERHRDTKLQTPYTSKNLQKRLLNTFYYARQSLDEAGVNTLYLALGMLTWYESPSSETKRRAPLVLVPVELNRTSVQGKFRVDFLGEEIGGNVSLQAKLEQDFGIQWPLPKPQMDPSTSMEKDFDMGAYVQQAKKAIQAHSRWHIDRNAIALGFFSFSRFLMYEDLDPSNWPDGKGPAEHPILLRLLDEGFDVMEDRIPDEANLDPFLDPEETHHVVNADSSQTRAILDVKRGHDLVLQGPPGTGKSQTITNIIAEAIGKGQSVLFVSEKMAALDVVKRNLDTVGLGDACLELHSHKTRKKAVLSELQRTMNLGKPKVEDFSEQATMLQQTRQRLNDYADAVNEPIGESGIRPYQAFGELVQLGERLSDVDRPVVEIDRIESWSRETFSQRELLVEQVQSHRSAIGVPADHPFWGSQRRRYLPADEVEIREAGTKAQKALDTLTTSAGKLADLCSFPTSDSVSEIDDVLAGARHVAKAPDLSGIPADASIWSEEPERIVNLAETGARYAEIHDTYDERLIPEAWEQDVLETRQRLAKHGEKWYRWVLSDWRSARDEVTALCQTDPPSTNDERLELVDAILEVQRHGREIDDNERLGEQAFGRVWYGRTTDWDTVTDAARYLASTYEAIANGDLPADLRSTLSVIPDTSVLEELIASVSDSLGRWFETVGQFADTIELDAAVRFEQEGTLAEQPFDVAENTLRRCLDTIPKIQEITVYNGLTDELKEEGLQALIPVSNTWEDADTHLVDLFQYVHYTALVERAMDEREAIARFSRPRHEQVIERFRQLDVSALEHNRHELALEHYESMPRRRGIGEVGVLLSEFGKKQRHMPIRTLMQRAGRAIQDLKPVFMMSPMSVPKYLAPDSIEFDLVIFDEASQVRPVDAFGSIIRGKQTVVVGDNKQLPPTSFFDASGGDGIDDDYQQRAGDQESILDLFLSRGAPERMLRFHYRSKHESLIAVSNNAFYDGNLFVFPSPDAEKTKTGLHYHHLPETTYDRGGSRKNRKEAEIVVERVMEHARERPDQSLGVATFSSAQQEAIREQLEVMRRRDPSCESFFNAHPSEPFFVKNLESVQGDQRDVIFISVGYGRAQDGRVSMNFGPLNSEGGERRLNVLTTRAKFRCEVFTNLRAEDIDLNRTRARGVEVLKQYLKFAETGEIQIARPTGEDPDSPFEEAVADALRGQGYQVEHQIGQSGFSIDLAIVDPERPGRYLLGIECDGATYHSSRMARDRDRARQAVLESQGWTIHRIWSTDWFRNPSDQLAHAVAAIEKAHRTRNVDNDSVDTETKEAESASLNDKASGDEHPSSQSESPVGVHDEQVLDEEAKLSTEVQSKVHDLEGEDATTEAENGESLEGKSVDDRNAGRDRGRHEMTTIDRAEPDENPTDISKPYTVAELHISTGTALHEVPRSTMGKWVRDVVEVESPVMTEVVARRILDAADVTRLGSRIRSAIEEGVTFASAKHWVLKKSDVLWQSDAQASPVRDRSGTDKYTRDIEHIPDAEIEVAVRRLLDGTYGAEREDVIRQVSRLLGFSKTGASINDGIDSVIIDMSRRGDVTVDGEMIQLAATDAEPDV